MATVVITGSSSGFGRRTAEALEERGHTVYATMRDSEGRNRDVVVEVVLVEPGPFTTDLFPRMVGPQDGEGRAGAYPELAHRTFEALAAAFEDMFADPDAPTYPQLVVDRICELVDMPAGTRPVRSVVGVDLGVRDRNVADEPHETAFLKMLGLTEFARLPEAPAQPIAQQ